MDIEITSKTFNNCCRTCLYDGPAVKYDIFGYKSAVNLQQMLSTYTPLKVQMDDKLPKKLCSGCYNCLLRFHHFTTIALGSDIKLRVYLSKNESQIKMETVNCDLNNGSENEDQSDIPVKMAININDSMEYDAIDDNIENKLSYPFYDSIKEKNSNISNKIAQPIKHAKSENVEYPITKKQPDKVKDIPKYNCSLCTEIFKYKKQYLQHLGNHTKEITNTPDSNVNVDQSLLCDICSLTFKSKHSLSAHTRVHIPKDRILKCATCGKVFNKLSHLKRHELSHKDTHPYKCTICKKSFASEDTLETHINMHKEAKNHRCPVCTKAFYQLQALTTHIKIHTRAKSCLCPTCGKTFDSTTNFNQHVKRHAGIKSFACNLCPRKFVSKGELKTHAATHTGEKPYKCSQCTSTFTKASSLKTHKLIHLGLKPHKCDVCVMRFVDKEHLKRHYRIHTGEKPYKCDICDRAFTQSNDLVKHKRIHLGNNLYKCDQCTQSFRLCTELRQHISEHFVSAQKQSKVANNEQPQTNDKTDAEKESN